MDLLQQFSVKFGVEMKTIRKGIFQEIVDGKWWKLDTFFKKLQEDDEQSNFLKSFIKEPSSKPKTFLSSIIL